jgi:hypothetical protein
MKMRQIEQACNIQVKETRCEQIVKKAYGRFISLCTPRVAQAKAKTVVVYLGLLADCHDYVRSSCCT